MHPSDCLIFARNRLQPGRPYTDAILARMEQAGRLLEPTCRDRVTATQEFRRILRALRRLEPGDGVTDAIAMMHLALEALERPHV